MRLKIIVVYLYNLYISSMYWQIYVCQFLNEVKTFRRVIFFDRLENVIVRQIKYAI